MSIHDELILELIKPDKWGKPTGYIVNIVGTSNIKCKVEESVRFVREVHPYIPSRIKRIYYQLVEGLPTETVIEEMTPDIIVEILGSTSKEKELVAIELETDMDFDFGKSLRQIKKYARRFKEVIIVIPKEYERFAVLYKNEGFRVYLWEATRIWECMRCGNTTEERKSIKPKCSRKSCRSTEQRLKGVKNVTFKEA